MPTILTDTGWTHTTPFRCCTESKRTVIWDSAPSEADIQLAWGKSHPRGQSEETRLLHDVPFAVQYIVFCDSSD